ncbi:hypothetical protein [Lyticum sinuosum]|uniref:Uncharacterized protein n=1 Tax=Lyticum sinuosum TaxID=1332059 RepID=A0AAE4VKB5_9RICK|nr:hypothetical protein [Lyticum sinuosum]MDZ5760913.1 hypothetical protein [Lyticum sinuosum]
MIELVEIFFIFSILFAIFIFLVFVIKIKSLHDKKSLEKKINSIKSTSPYSSNNTSFTYKKPKKPNQRDKNAEIQVARETVMKNKNVKIEQINDMDLSELEHYNSQETGQLASEEQLLQGQDQEKIIGFAEPQGKWTRLIMGKNIFMLMAKAASINRGSGFWQTFILLKNHQKSQGKEQNRGI